MSYLNLITAPASFELFEVNNDEVFTSMTGAVQVASRSGARYRLTMNWRRAGADLRVLRGELSGLNAMRNRLWVYMFQLDYVRGGVNVGSNVNLNGAHVAGATTINLKSLPSSTANLLLPGDYIQIGSFGQLTNVTSVLSSSGTTGSLTVWPPLQKNRADNEAVSLNAPGGLFIKTSEHGFGSSPMPSDWFCEVSADFIQDVMA